MLSASQWASLWARVLKRGCERRTLWLRAWGSESWRRPMKVKASGSR